MIVNAPTIRPLINRLCINRLDEQEQEEIKQGLHLARESAHNALARLFNAGVLSRGSRYRMEKKIDQMLKNPERELTRPNNLRFGRIRLLRAEMEVLNTLYQEGVLKQYTFLDLKGELRPKNIKARRGRTCSSGWKTP